MPGPWRYADRILTPRVLHAQVHVCLHLEQSVTFLHSPPVHQHTPRSTRDGGAGRGLVTVARPPAITQSLDGSMVQGLCPARLLPRKQMPTCPR